MPCLAKCVFIGLLYWSSAVNCSLVHLLGFIKEFNQLDSCFHSETRYGNFTTLGLFLEQNLLQPKCVTRCWGKILGKSKHLNVSIQHPQSTKYPSIYQFVVMSDKQFQKGNHVCELKLTVSFSFSLQADLAVANLQPVLLIKLC